MPEPSAPIFLRRAAFAGLLALGAVAACSAKPPTATAQKANSSTRRDSTYYREPPDFSKTNLVIRIPGVVFRGDTVTLAVQLRDLGRNVVRVSDIRLGLSSESTGVRVDGTRMPFEGMIAPRAIEIPPDGETEVLLTHFMPDDPGTLGMLRCGEPFYLQLWMQQFDDSLRPRVLSLSIGNFRRDTYGVMFRSRAFRYFVAENRIELESRNEWPAPSSPGFLMPLTKRMLALQMDSSKTSCLPSKREYERARKAHQ